MKQAMDFYKLGIQREWVEALFELGIVQPTPIQQQTIPAVLSGKDVVGQAQTGTGKTLAFVLPILEKIEPENPELQALIVAPTRELAIQITAEVKKLTSTTDEIRVLAVYGGQDVLAQMHKLEQKAHIVVATPGRLLDHVRRETISLSRVRTLVLDEADQMLHIGFLEDVEAIINQTPADRQTLLFSATMPDEVRRLAERFMREPADVRIKPEQVTVKEIRQRIIETTDRSKQSDVLMALKQLRPHRAILFFRTKRRVTRFYEALLEAGFSADELHGDLSQAKREEVMQRFRSGSVQFLAATDVAARGLDVEGITHVLNVDIPLDSESYIHRIGRTGRAGGSGLAVTFVAQKDRRLLALIEQDIGMKLKTLTIDKPVVPQAAEVKQDQGKKVLRKPEKSRGGINNPRPQSADRRKSNNEPHKKPSYKPKRQRGTR